MLKKALFILIFASLTCFFIFGAWVVKIDQQWSPLIEPRIRQRQQIGSIRILAPKNNGAPPQWVASLTAGKFQERKPLKLAEVNPLLLHAVMELEDPRFLKHGGFDVWGILRAAVANLKTLRFSQGGSTITQQLVKNLFLNNEKKLIRKMREVVLAALVEKRFKKDDILEAYVNEVYMGQLGSSGVNGFARAAEYYFGKDQKNLLLHEIALIAAVIASPGYYSPWKHPQRSLARRNKVLRKLLEAEKILETEYQSALQKKLLPENTHSYNTRASYATDAIRDELIKLHGEETVMHGGFDVMTSLDLNIQKLAEQSIRKQSQKWPKGMQGVILAANPRTCEIKTYVGGTKYEATQYDRAQNATRSIGSLMKPLMLATQLENDPQSFHLAKGIQDEKLTWTYNRGRQSWSPNNYDLKFRGLVSLRTTLEQSLNVPYVKLFHELSPEGTLDAYFNPARNLGLKIPFKKALPSALIGTAEQTPLTMLHAYVKLTRQALGLSQDALDSTCQLKLSKIDQHSAETGMADKYLKNKFFDEKTPENLFSSARHAYNQKGALLTLLALQGALRRGTSRFLGQQISPYQAWAGKTGTSSDKKDSWYVALSPEWVFVAWMGKDDNTQTPYTGASGALRLITPLVKAVSQKQEPWFWPDHEDLEWQVIDPRNLCRPNRQDKKEFMRKKSETLNEKGLPSSALVRNTVYSYELFSQSPELPMCQ